LYSAWQDLYLQVVALSGHDLPVGYHWHRLFGGDDDMAGAPISDGVFVEMGSAHHLR
jgi:hypothetical protein